MRTRLRSSPVRSVLAARLELLPFARRHPKVQTILSGGVGGLPCVSGFACSQRTPQMPEKLGFETSLKPPHVLTRYRQICRVSAAVPTNLLETRNAGDFPAVS